MVFSLIANPLHVLGAVIWVGGMFFAHVALRPAMAGLEPPVRLDLWARVFPRFFAWVWLSVVTLLATGYGVLFWDFGGMAEAPLHIHLMQGLGLVMAALYVFLFLVPYRRFRATVAAADWPRAASHLATIRRIVATNLGLGLLTTVIGASGRFW